MCHEELEEKKSPVLIPQQLSTLRGSLLTVRCQHFVRRQLSKKHFSEGIFFATRGGSVDSVQHTYGQTPEAIKPLEWSATHWKVCAYSEAAVPKGFSPERADSSRSTEAPNSIEIQLEKLCYRTGVDCAIKATHCEQSIYTTRTKEPTSDCGTFSSFGTEQHS